MKAEQLRKSILQMAIQGKLVPQNPDDEPASVLLDRIRAEKQKLIEEGKIKKDKFDSIIYKGDDNRYYEKIGNEVRDITEEIPFDIPNTWKWIRLGHLIEINGGFAFKSENYVTKEQGVRVLRISDFNESGFDTKKPVYHKYSPFLETFALSVGDIIMCMTGGTVGKSYFVESLPEPMIVNQRVADIKINNRLIKKFVYTFIRSPYIQTLIEERKNSTNDNISVNLINSFLTPLPPLSEQSRIVTEIEKYEPLITEYDELEQAKSNLDNEIYDKLRKSILQYAIQGKLVPQDPNDEPASELLKRIRAEKKAKLGKKYVDSYIYKGDDNCYYEKNGFNNAFIKETRQWVTVKNSFTHIKNGDVGFAKITPCFQNRKSAVFVNLMNEYGAGTTELHILRTYGANTFISEYLLWFVKSPYFIELGKQNLAGTAGQQRFATEIVKRTLIPIPPFNEQIRIVETIKQALNVMTKNEDYV